MPVENLDAALESVRERGYARLRFQLQGILSLGLPLGEKPFAALALSGPWQASETERIVGILRDTAKKILHDLLDVASEKHEMQK